MSEDNLPDFIRNVIESGITVKEQKLIRDVLFELAHELKDKHNEESKRKG